MIVKLKVCITGKIFVSQNYQRYLLSKYVVCNQERVGVGHEGEN